MGELLQVRAAWRFRAVVAGHARREQAVGRFLMCLLIWVSAQLLMTPNLSWHDVQEILGGLPLFSIVGYLWYRFYQWTLIRDDDNRPVE